jgi:hypothetical protein
MSETLKIVATAAAGIAVFVAGQIIIKWFIEPIQEQRKIIGEIAHALTYYTDYYAFDTNIETISAGMMRLRNLAAELNKNLMATPCYGLLTFFRLVRPRKVIENTSIAVMKISRNVGYDAYDEFKAEIVSLLKLELAIPTTKQMMD